MNSTHNDDGWVTNLEVIRTIVLIKGLQPGDQVRLKECMDYGIKSDLDGDVVTLRATAPGSDPSALVWNTERWPQIDKSAHMHNSVPIAQEETGYYLALWNIAAWRRPPKEKA